MKFALILVLTISTFTVFANAEKTTGESMGNSQNPCVGCALRAAQIDQENRRAGKELSEKRKEIRGKSSGARANL